MRCTAGYGVAQLVPDCGLPTGAAASIRPWAFLSSERMTSLSSSTLLLAAFAPAPVSSEAVSPPAHHTRQYTDFEKRYELLLRVDLAAGGGSRLHPPCRAQDTIAIEPQQTGEEAGPRSLRCRLQRKHLHMALADLEVITVPRNRSLYDLPVHASIAAQLVTFCPFLKIEQVTEELEGFVLTQKPQVQWRCQGGFEEWLRSSQGLLASGRCLRRFPAASARTLLPSTAPA